ncbi:ASCH domain-containing protein [Streptomyces rubiginosohelvolus]|uniref:ASCH domain-containing protein n=1 Tax=Streptomyces rubiginosohelvolus TaxID=67362 RepID=UPI0036B6DF1E
MNTPERALLLSLHPRFATAILNGEKTVELRRQRVAVPPGTPVIIYATSPTMALTGTARLTGVDAAAPAHIWRRHRSNCGIRKAEYMTYMEGATQASALLLDSPQPLTDAVPLAHLRHTGGFHPPQSYRYLTLHTLRTLLDGHSAATELLSHLGLAHTPTTVRPAAFSPSPQTASPTTPPHIVRSAVLLAAPAS